MNYSMHFLFSLRISRLNDEMRETEFGEAPDDTLQEMVRDFLRWSRKLFC